MLIDGTSLFLLKSRVCVHGGFWRSRSTRIIGIDPASPDQWRNRMAERSPRAVYKTFVIVSNARSSYLEHGTVFGALRVEYGFAIEK